MSAPSPADPTQSSDWHTLSLGAATPWHQEQFERHHTYARSLGLSPASSRRFALQQLQTAKAHQAANRAT